MERGKVNGDFRTNFSLGASIKGKTISDEIKKLALRASKAVGGYFTGVDICITKGTKKPFIIEINSSPGSEGIEKASSKNITQIFVNHIIDKKNWDYPPTIVGRREMVNIEGVGPVQAKFDTGNMVVNSIHAEDIKVNGKTVTWKHGGKTFKNKIIDELIVLQGAIAANREKRVMIELDMEFLGKNYQKRRFTLDDRSNKGTPVLIGVPFMKEFHIIVDPGKRFIKTEKLDERKMTDAEMDKREKIVKKLKRKKDEFESRYGKDAKSVMYATATKLAMGEEESDSEKDERIHKGSLEATTARRKKYAKYTPGQVNELADTYFKGEL
jgi:hypothetical protein